MIKSLSFQDPPIWFKTQLVVSGGGGHSLPLPYADQTFCQHIPKTSRPPLWPGGLNLPPAKLAAVSANGQLFCVIYHQHVSPPQSVKEASLSGPPGATLAVTPTLPELEHGIRCKLELRNISFFKNYKIDKSLAAGVQYRYYS